MQTTCNLLVVEEATYFANEPLTFKGPYGSNVVHIATQSGSTDFDVLSAISCVWLNIEFYTLRSMWFKLNSDPASC